MATPIDLNIVATHLGIIKGYLLGMCAPGEVMNSYKFLIDELFIITELSDGEARLDALIASAGTIPEPDRKKNAWTEEQKKEVWRLRFDEGKKPADIAARFPGKTAPMISNLLQTMKTAAKYA